MKEKVEFNAHKTVKKPVEVEFKKRDGTEIDFVAKKNVKVPVHVKFKANVK
jgi:predicted AAA+ superfamily ATPase